MKAYNLEIVKQTVESSLTINEAKKKLHIGNEKLKKIIKNHNICTKHFKRGGRRKPPTVYFKNCPQCEKKFKTIYLKQQCCSRSCANSYCFRGNKHSNYKCGKHSYRQLCFRYYEFKCIVCDENQMLDVHHLDKNRDNNVIENLIPLCPTHHRYMHNKKLKEQLLNIIEEKKYERNLI